MNLNGATAHEYEELFEDLYGRRPSTEELANGLAAYRAGAEAAKTAEFESACKKLGLFEELFRIN